MNCDGQLGVPNTRSKCNTCRQAYLCGLQKHVGVSALASCPAAIFLLRPTGMIFLPFNFNIRDLVKKWIQFTGKQEAFLFIDFMPGIVNPLLICFPFCPMAPRRPLETQVKLWLDFTDIRVGMKWGLQLKKKKILLLS